MRISEVFGFATKNQKTTTVKKKKVAPVELSLADRLKQRRAMAAQGNSDAFKSGILSKKNEGVEEGLDFARLERLDPQSRRVLSLMADHARPGSWLSAEEAYAIQLGLQRKKENLRAWEHEVKIFVDLYKEYSNKGVAENFADGKVKGKSRPGRVKRAGASCAGSVTDLRAKAKKYSGEKAKMYHWCANMKGGKK